MAKRRHRKTTGGRTTPKGTRPIGARPRREHEDDHDVVPELVQGIRPVMHAPTSFDMLTMASGFVEIVTERPMDNFGLERMEKVDGPDFLGSLVDPGWPELVVLGRAMATLMPDRPAVRRLRTQRLPPGAPSWVATMHEIEVVGTHVQTDPLGDGDNMWVCVSWPDGSEATAIMFVDHNMGTLVKDAFLIPAGADAVMQTMDDVSDDVVALQPFDAADLRARVEWSIQQFDRTVPAIESETWPSCRPLVEWIVGHLPAGGLAWEFPEWTPAERAQLLTDFLASPHAGRCPLPLDGVRAIAQDFIAHGCDFGSGDPLRWSPVVVEIVLADWYPRKVYGSTKAEIEAVPAVLEQFVSFAHDRRGVDPDDTRETLSSIVIWEDDFFEGMADQTSQASNATRLAHSAMGLDPEDFLDDFDDDEPGFPVDDDAESVLLNAILGGPDGALDMDAVTDGLEQRVTELVGGREAYDNLDDEPLGNVEFDWSVVPDDMGNLTRETLEHLDRWSIEHFDEEVRSIARVTLAAVVTNDRSVFKRSARTDVLAAAILGYLIHWLSDRFDRKGKEALGWTAPWVSPFAEAVGLTPATVGARVKTVTKVMARAEVDWPRYLHSTQRRTAMESKQNIIDYRSRTAD